MSAPDVRHRRDRRWHHRRRHRARRGAARPQGRAVREGRLRVGHVVEVEQAVHGGLRYLEHGEIGLVFESVSERRVQTARRAAPRAPAAVPDPDLQGREAGPRDDERRPVDLRLARAVPRAEAAQDVSRHARPRSSSSRSCAPRACAARSSTTTAPPTTRGSCSRTRSTRARSAPTATRTPRSRGSSARDDGRITGVAVRDRLTGETWTRRRARVVILAAGAWTDEMIRAVRDPDRAAAAAPHQGRAHRGAARAPAARARDHADLARRSAA